jgi:hypothetical protein
MQAIFLLLLLASLVDRRHAFAPPSPHQRNGPAAVVHHHHRSRSTGVSIGASVRDNHDFDVNAARRQLESLLEAGGPSSSASSPSQGRADWPIHSAATAGFVVESLFAEGQPSTDLRGGDHVLDFLSKAATEAPAAFPRPVLTSMDRARRLAEMKLLSQLAPFVDNNDGGEGAARGAVQDHEQVLNELWNLWFHERGPRAAARLTRAEELVAQGPRQWDAAESALRDLVMEYGLSWAEPMNRLATLYYLQRRYRAAERLCRAVLSTKPWHFGALSGIVLVYEGLRDTESAQRWAARRLPTHSSSNKRRAVWVQQAVKNAEQSLLEAERSVSRAFGEPDKHATRKNRRQSQSLQQFSDLEDSWQ